ncbi:TadE/TadG family type IV pilus assembly protein [Roseospira navarrensis]|uniref:Pilus assembly protein TadG n=1 Tax=Roseospira navarrensis TaxID=140058 RepID=A0A7X2D281_9PROT|nr:TadE/TadG family type IV pilus assembly protein [Roseospira navarrensis]MQX36024.1 pilus assembly protein TadG [Roseospira navarrensis]
MTRETLLKALCRLRSDRRGAIAVIVGLVMLPLFMALGASLDLAIAYYLKSRLGYAVDAAALAAGSTITDDQNVLDDRARDFFAVNYPNDTIGWVHDISVTEVNNIITVSAKATFDTFFLKLFQKPQVTVSADAVINREIKGLEVALVLDNTGSMRSNNNIGALRTAATTFVNILYGNEAVHDGLFMSIVPYAASVNPGPEAFGGSTTPTAPSWWPDPSNPNYEPYEYDPNGGTQWKGCVIERTGSDLMGDDNATGWEPFAWEAEVSNDYDVNDIPGTTRYDPSTYQNGGTGPNLGCPSPILPLINVKQTLLDEVAQLDAWHRGGTMSDMGIAWGRRVLSPEAPYTEGKAWDTDDWEKAIVMMTDGQSQFYQLPGTAGPNEKNTSVNSDFTGYEWLESSNPRIGTDSKSVAEDLVNGRLATACEDLKALGVTIYTITFTSSIDAATKQVYKDCATDETKWFDSPSQADLQNSFKKVAIELSKLRVSR